MSEDRERYRAALPEESAPGEDELRRTVADLAHHVRRLARIAPDCQARTQALEYLQRKGLQGSILREGA